jgi:hypothetical protein
LVGLPRMAADLIRRLTAEQPDVTVAAELSASDRVEPVLTSTGARFLIVGMADSTLPQHLADVFARRPELLVLGVSVDAGNAYLFELRPHAVPVGELSASLLIGLARLAEAGP